MVLTPEQQNKILYNQRTLPLQRISNRFAGLSVLGLVADSSACGYYRVINPLHLLMLHGATVEYGSYHSFDKFLHYDNILAPRQFGEEISEILRMLPWEDKNVIFELDDDLDSVLPESPAYAIYHPGAPELKALHKVISFADGMTVTTPELAKWHSQDTQNMAIIGNYIDYGFRNWGASVMYDSMGYPTINLIPVEKPKEWEGKLVIGYSGGSTHGPDLPLMGADVKYILANYPQTHFAIYMSPVQAEEFVASNQLPRDRVTIIEARHFLDYPDGLHGIDIGLAPISGNQFNVCKSDLKFKEYMALGIVPIGSHIGPYARFVRKNPGYALTVGQAKDSFKSFKEAVIHLIEHPEIRLQMSKAGRQFVADNYSLEKNIELWPKTWQKLVERKYDGKVGPPAKVLPKESYRSWGTLGRNDPCGCGSGLKYKNCCPGSWG